ncbi:MAG: hypothetical protein JW855_04620, partial [Gammaproteobacteria bacterium]|nr:hypothetical protein [Gammaproteobacteria bacterium]
KQQIGENLMGTIGRCYGSEWHLLRYLGRHRAYLNQQIIKQIGGEELSWLDFNFSNENKNCLRDSEWNGLDFITDPDVLRNWYAFWPTSGRSQNWDAVGKLRLANGTEEWLLVEAKAHLHEEKSRCGATSARSIEKIKKALTETKAAFAAASTPLEIWYEKYYQYANRLAALYFLREICQPPVPVRLLYIYFLGDIFEDQHCPETREDWENTINKMENQLGIDRDCPLYARMSKLFLYVNPEAK